MSKAYIELCLGKEHPTVRIEYPYEPGHMESVLDNLIKPALLGSGYVQQTVDKVVLIEEED